jgi:hypothetical protein
VGGDGEAPAVIDQQAEEADESLPEPPTASSVPGPDFEGEEPPGTVTPPAEGAPEFVATFTSGKFKGKTIVEIYSEGKDGISYVKWALKNWKTGPIVAELKAFAELHPEVR